MKTKVVKGVKKTAVRKAKTIHAEDIDYMADLRHLPSVPDMQRALICEVDDRSTWEAKTGMVPSALPRIARIAAKLNNGEVCKWCKKKQSTVSEDLLFHFHKDTKLCNCLMVQRNKSYTHIQGWDTPTGRDALVKAFMSRKLEADAPVYQVTCKRCKRGPVVITASVVVSSLVKSKRHISRSLCDVCHLEIFIEKEANMARRNPAAAGLTVPLAQLVGSPKKGPEGHLSKNQKKKRHPSGPQGAAVDVVIFKPLTALTEAQEAPPT